MSEEQVLEARNIAMTFGNTQALRDVDFTVRPGEIRALIGANGAGKSTLMKILAGANPGYTGEVLLGKTKLALRLPMDAQKHGIRIVSQEVDMALVPDLSVTENILMGGLLTRAGFVDQKSNRLDAQIALRMLGCSLDADKRARELTLAEKQMVLLARVIARESRFLLLDEPTAALSAAEAQKLFAVIRRLAKQQKVGIILVSHRIRELLQVCETMTVLRDGKLVDTFVLDGLVGEADIVRMMSGREPPVCKEESSKTCAQRKSRAAGGHTVPGEELLRIQELCDRAGRFKNIALSVKRGEIVGVGGLAGAGKTELCRAIFGAGDCAAGSVFLRGAEYDRRSPGRSVKKGLALIPEERRQEGIWPDQSLRFNLTSCVLADCAGRLGFLHRKKEEELAGKMMDSAGILAASHELPIRYLSGGNQQKAVIGKWLLTGAELFLFDEATKGVDVSSKAEIFALIRALSESGRGVLYFTSELEELPGLCDRVYVLYNGEICRELQGADSEEILYYAAGGGGDVK